MRLSIRQKLLAGFGVLLALLVGALPLSASTMSERIGDVVEGISQRIERITTFAKQVEADAEKRKRTTTDVSAMAEQSSASAEQISASTEQTSASAQEIAATAQELAGSAEELNRLVVQFKV